MENEIFNDSKVSKAYLKLSIPLVLSLVVSLVYNLADTFFVAQTNNTSIVAGVSLGMPVFTILMAIGNTFAQGGSSLISRFLGQNNSIGVKKVSSFCFYMSLITGVVMGVVMLIFREAVLYLIGASEDTFFHASEYYSCLAAGAPAVIVSFIHSNLLRAEGMSKESMIGTITGAVVNIILDPIFISVLGWDARGAAAATVIGYIFADIYMIVIVVKKSRTLSVNPKEMIISGKDLGQIFGIGIPAAVVNLMQSLSVAVINQFLLPYGDEKIAAMGIVLKVNMIGILLLTGFAFGGQPLFGYYYGANDKEKFLKLLKYCIRFITVLAAGLSVVLFLTASLLMKCFISNDQIIEDGTVMLRWQVITLVFVGIVLLLTIVFQSTGKIIGSFILSVSRQGIVFLVIIVIAYQIMGYMGIIISQAVADIITAFLACFLFYKQLYKEIR